jgi:hypothetical protein
MNEFDDDRVAAVRTHRRCGFVPDAVARGTAQRATRL